MIRRFPLLAGIALLSSAGAAVCQTAAHQPPQQQQAEASPDIAEPGIVFAERQPAIPFELFREQRIFFTGKVNGSATEMMLDSGASITVIDRKFADSLGIKADEQVSVQGVSAEAQGGIARGVDLDVGGLGIRDATVLILDMDAIARGVGRAVPVVLGHEAMDAGVVTIDFPARTIRFASREGFAPPPGARKVAMGHDGPLRTVKLSIAGLPEVDAVFDIGNGGSLHLARNYWSDKPQFATLPWAEVQFGGVGGLKLARKATVPYVDFAGERLPAVPAVLNTDGESLPRDGANIGIELLKPFVVTTDYAADSIYLQRAGAWSGFRRERAGIRAELVGQTLKLAHVAPQGPAAAAGLKAGDAIVAIDGEPVGADYYASGRSEWLMAAAGTAVELTRADGRKARVVLRDYY